MLGSACDCASEVYFEFVEGVLFGWRAVREKGNCSSLVVNEQV